MRLSSFILISMVKIALYVLNISSLNCIFAITLFDCYSIITIFSMSTRFAFTIKCFSFNAPCRSFMHTSLYTKMNCTMLNRGVLHIFMISLIICIINVITVQPLIILGIHLLPLAHGLFWHGEISEYGRNIYNN